MEKNKIPFNLLLTAGIMYGLYYFGKKVKELFTGSTAQLKELEQFQTADYWSPQYYKDRLPCYVLTQAGVTEAINNLNNAPGILNDKEELVYSVFQKLRAKTQVSYLAEKWAQGSTHTLYQYLASFLNPAELYNVKKIIDSKPSK